jgi:hypothetical protein
VEHAKYVSWKLPSPVVVAWPVCGPLRPSWLVLPILMVSATVSPETAYGEPFWYWSWLVTFLDHPARAASRKAREGAHPGARPVIFGYS